MNKRLISFALALVMLFGAIICANADSVVQLNELSACKKVFAYSGQNSAHFYGFYGKTLCSARVIPDVSVRWATVEGGVLAMCHDGETACALYKTGHEKYSAALLNVNSGRLVCRALETGEAVQFSSIAYSRGEVFVITVENGRSFVTGCTDGQNYKYDLTADVRQLFVNGGDAYAVADDSNVFRISRGVKTFCRALPDKGMVENAGSGYVYTSDGALVNLSGGTEYPRAKHAVKSDGVTFTDNGRLPVAAACGYSAVPDESFNCVIKPLDSFSPAGQGKAAANIIDGVVICRLGVTVKEFRESYPEVSEVRDKNGKALDSGKIRTGCVAVANGRSFEIAVSGDLDGTATATKNDIGLLMRYFAGGESLLGSAKTAADMNGDGTLDNRDLVLLAREAA